MTHAEATVEQIARMPSQHSRAVPTNSDVAATFEELADLLAISGDNPFRIRAYQRAARMIRALGEPLGELRKTRSFDELPGIGADLAAKIEEILDTGTLRALRALRRKVPAGLRELLRLPGLGPVRVRALHERLGVRDPEGLVRALAAGRVAALRGFGPASCERLRTALAAHAPARRRWVDVDAVAAPLRSYLLGIDGVSRVELAGSLRRGRDTVGDLDVVIAGRPGIDLGAVMRGYAPVRSIEAAGPTRCSAILRDGLQVDLRRVNESSFGAALYYFTGGREHNIHLRRVAQERGLKLNEYGLFRGRRRIAGASESDILAALGLHFIPPELREDRGEIEAAAHGELPALVTLADLRGDLHVHTRASDGSGSLETMVAAARLANLDYIAVTDHSRHLGIVRGLDFTRLERQMRDIDALGARLTGFTLLKGIEVDILRDGDLALPAEILSRLDVVVAAIHDHFDLDAAAQTRRLLRALEHPAVTILAHPAARLINERAPIRFDLDAVLDALRAKSRILELDSQPARLDADDTMLRAAQRRGVLVSIASDAHGPTGFTNLAHGVRQARRGWLTAADVLNTRPLADVRALLARARA